MIIIKIFFVGSLSYTFAKRDFEILKKRLNVDVIEPIKKIKVDIINIYC